MSRGKHTLRELCKLVGKNHVYVGQIQGGLNLIKPEPPQYYSTGYVNFIKKCTALRTFGVQIGDIQDLFRKEIKLLKLLNMHTSSKSPTWFLDGCIMDNRDKHKLLLTGYNIGFDVLHDQVQAGLDFGSREEELFARHQMGESLEHVINLYRKQRQKIKRRVDEERPIIRMSINWSSKAFDF